MSTTTTTTTQSVPAPSPTAPSSSSHDSDTATLYLFTFLATILILVLLSASLILRSYVLRRRYRQRFQEALADGLFLDFDATYPRSTRRVGPKPVVWDTWIHPTAEDATSWSSMKPVAVRSSPLLSPPSSVLSSPSPSRTHLFSQLRIPSPFTLSPVPSPPPPLSPALPETPPFPERDIAVCVLVAMPDVAAPIYRPAVDTKGKGVGPPASTADADPLLRCPCTPPRGRLPLLEFGVAELTIGEYI